MPNHTLSPDAKVHKEKLEYYLAQHTQDLIDNTLDEAKRGHIWNVIGKTIKKTVIETTLRNTENKPRPQCQGNQTQAANMLGINRATLRSYQAQGE